MANKVTLKRSSVVGKVPQTSDLDFGEVALNFADGRLYYKNSSDQIDFFEKSVEASGFSILENDTDLGSVDDVNVTSFLDAGLIGGTISDEYDLGSIAITGFISPNVFVLPSFDSSSFPSVSPSSQLIYVSDNNTLAFSDGNNWNELSTVATTGSYDDLSDTPALATVATTGSYDDLSDTPPEGATTGKAIAMAIVFG